MNRTHARYFWSVPVAILALTGVALAQPGPGGPPGMNPQRDRQQARMRDGGGPGRPVDAAPEAPAPGLDRLFNALDADGDGKIDREEMERKGPDILRAMRMAAQNRPGPAAQRGERGLEPGGERRGPDLGRGGPPEGGPRPQARAQRGPDRDDRGPAWGQRGPAREGRQGWAPRGPDREGRRGFGPGGFEKDGFGRGGFGPGICKYCQAARGPGRGPAMGMGRPGGRGMGPWMQEGRGPGPRAEAGRPGGFGLRRQDRDRWDRDGRRDRDDDRPHAFGPPARRGGFDGPPQRDRNW